MNDETLGLIATRAANRCGWSCSQKRAMLESLAAWYKLNAPPVPGSNWLTVGGLRNAKWVKAYPDY